MSIPVIHGTSVANHRIRQSARSRIQRRAATTMRSAAFHRGSEKNRRRAARVVTPAVQLDVIKEDQPHSRILESAVTGGSDYIVTGDRDCRA